MKAGLPMYDPPELRREVDAWWGGLVRAFRREGLTEAPDSLDRSRPAEELWRDPALFFAQACGLPLIGDWADHIQYVATPRYAAPGCVGTDYRSFVVVAAESRTQSLAELRGARCAVNGLHSHSGCNALRAAVAPLARDGRFFSSVAISGSHARSLAMVAAGAADVAGIDCVTHAILSRCRPGVIAATRILAESEPAPALPYVTRKSADGDLVARLRAGLLRAADDPDLAAVRAALLIDGIAVLPSDSYRRIAEFAREAERWGYDIGREAIASALPA